MIALNDEIALVQTLDFITPIVGDPFIFGAIAAANSLSDVFAMGGEVLSAMNIMSFDSLHHKSEIAKEIMAGGASKIFESGGVLAGGHSVRGSELFYGLSVTGKVARDGFWANNTARVGNALILTKPLGSGVLSTALKNGALNEAWRDEMIEQMSTLNLRAMRVLRQFSVSGATDVTGFGFLGHLGEMLNPSVEFEIYGSAVPLMSGVRECINAGFVPGGSMSNRDFASVPVKESSDEVLMSALYDAQTSGGLLVALPEKQAQSALNALKNEGYEQASIVGLALTPKSQKRIIIK